jgi:hypothetical protein
MKCTKCWIETEEIFYNIILEECCEECQWKLIDLSKLNKETLNNALYNLIDLWWYDDLFREWEGREGREVYDFPTWYNVDIVLKVWKNNSIKEVNYQNFVEKYIYNNSDEKIRENLLWKIYNSEDLRNTYLFTENCLCLDKDFFYWIDLRNEEEYESFVLNDKEINIKNF